MVSPKGGVLEIHTLNLYVLTVGDIDQSWTLLILVGAVLVPFAAKPELFMVL